MKVKLKEDMFQSDDPLFPNWSRIYKLILIPSRTPKALLSFVQSHESTYSKIKFAQYHYHILDQLYQPKITQRERDTQHWVRAEMHSIIINLYSALDSLAQQINCIYHMGFSPSEINFNHFRYQIPQGPIKSHLDKELKPDWFDTFNKFRNLMVHKNLPVLLLVPRSSTTTIIMPDDPLKHDPQSPPTGNDDYSMRLEANQYCKDRLNDITRIIEGAYPLLENDIKINYGL
jgi:hypothetical protein